jgi:hypothetical protein
LGKGDSLILGAHYLGQFVEYEDVTPFVNPENNKPITEEDLPEELQAVDASIGGSRVRVITVGAGEGGCYPLRM